MFMIEMYIDLLMVCRNEEGTGTLSDKCGVNEGSSWMIKFG